MQVNVQYDSNNDFMLFQMVKQVELQKQIPIKNKRKINFLCSDSDKVLFEKMIDKIKQANGIYVKP